MSAFGNHVNCVRRQFWGPILRVVLEAAILEQKENAQAFSVDFVVDDLGLPRNAAAATIAAPRWESHVAQVWRRVCGTTSSPRPAKRAITRNPLLTSLTGFPRHSMTNFCVGFFVRH